MPVRNINLSDINWDLVEDNDVRELYKGLQGEVCYNGNETCKQEMKCMCLPCHRCGHQLCVCRLVNEYYHTNCGGQLSCYCLGVEELNIDFLAVGSYGIGGSVTPKGDEQGGPGI